MSNVKTIPLADIKPLARNPRKATKRSQYLIEQSFEQNGAGRSILLAANGDILAGNHATQAYADMLGQDDLLVVQTDGTKLVAVQRTDIPNAQDERAKRLIMADNRASDVATYDSEVLLGLLQSDKEFIETFYEPNELSVLLSELQGDIDYDSSWQGMPDFDNPDAKAPYHVMVHFMSVEAKLAFGQLLQQAITEKTTYLYYPALEKANGD